MQINVAQLLKSDTGTIRAYAVDSEVEIEGVIHPVKGELTFINIGKKILATGKLTTTANFTCSRCLQPFITDLSLKIEDEYYPSVDVNTGFKVDAPEDEDAFIIDEHHTLDLSEAIRQYILLALPMKPLCRQDCGGICQTCGQDLNEGKCECPSEAIDPRWADLLKLKKNTRGTVTEKRGKEGRRQNGPTT